MIGNRVIVASVGVIISLFLLLALTPLVLAETSSSTEPVTEESNVVVDESSSSTDETEVIDEETTTSTDEGFNFVSDEETPTEEVIPTPEVSGTATDTVEVDESAETATEEATIPAPELSTDKADYHPGEVVTIFGKFFGAVKDVYLRVAGFSYFNGDSVDDVVVTTDEDGSFEYKHQLDDVFRLDYVVTAFNEVGDAIAEVLFTDSAASINIEQCANGPTAGPLNICKKLSGQDGYVTGNVTASKAHYTEGDFLPYRAVIEAPNPGPQRVTLAFDTAKSSDAKHAIDYLSSFNLTETTGAANSSHANQHDPCSDIIAGCNPSSPTVTAPIPVPASLTTAYPAGCDANGTFSGTPTNGVISAWVTGGTISNLTVDISAPDTGSSDCQSQMKINFNLSAGATVVFAWSGHVAANEDPGSGGYWGVGNAVPSGSPYHMRVDGAQYSGALLPPDGNCGVRPGGVPKNECEFNAGNQELQLSAGAIAVPQVGNIIIAKQTDPDGSPTQFTFDPSWSANNITLADGQTSNSGDLQTGIYSVSEINIPAGWTLSGTTCSDGSAVNSINLAVGETVTCTFTNTLQTGTIIVDKVTNPSGASQAFSFDTTGTNYGGFALADASTPNSQVLNAGIYAVEESPLAGWELTNTACVSSIGDTETAGNLELDAGETITCTFTNTKDGSITVVKEVVGADKDFNFTGDIVASLGDGESETVSVAPGQYDVTETIDEDYSLTDITCDDGNSDGVTATGITTFNVEAGEDVVCTYTNSELPTLTLVKVLPNDNGGTATQSLFQASIDDEEVDWDTAHTLPVGVHDADEDENAVPGYTAGSWSGEGCSATGGVDLDYGDHLTCSISNDDQPGKISGHKFEDVNGNGVWDEGELPLSGWVINLNGDEATDTTDGNGYYEFDGLSKGLYTITEEQQTGWTQTTTNPAEIDLDNGEVVENINFGNFELVSISGSKFNDDEGDGAITGDSKLSGWTIRLYEVNGEDWDFVSETDTDGSGNYTFTGLFKGSYKVCEVLEEGWIQTFASTQGTNDSPSESEEGQWCVTRNVTTSGDDPSAANFGNYEAKDLTVAKTAETTFTRTFEWTIDKSVTPDTLDMFQGDSADVEYEVEVTKDDGTDSDFAVTGTITITNPNPASTGLDATVTSVVDTISDGIPADVLCLEDVVPAGGQIECTYSADLPDSEDRLNTAVVTTTGIVGGGEGTADVVFGDPTTLVNDTINVDDTNGDEWQFSDDDTETYPATLTCNVDEGEHTNTVTIEETKQQASAEVNVNCYELTVTKDAATTYTRTFDWEIEKTVDPAVIDMFEGDNEEATYGVTVTKLAGVDSDFAVTGNITVTNNAPIAATVNTVADTLTGGVDAVVVCPGEAPYEIDANGGTLKCTYSADLDDTTQLLNTATAALQNTPSGTTNFTGTANVAFGDPTTVINDEVEITDSMLEDALDTTDASDEYEYSHEFLCDADAGKHTNTVTVIGDNDTELDSDSADVDVNCYDLTVTKDADTSFTRTWTWTVLKTGDETELTLAPDQVYPVDYEVTVDAESVDSDYAVSGTITITNPAPIAANLSSVIDSMTGDLDADVECDTLVVPANDSIDCTYSSDLLSDDTLTNTAVATLENGTQYNGTAEVNFASATITEIDEEVTIDDDLYGDLGTLYANSDTLPKVYNYTMDVGPYPVEECGTDVDVVNTATVYLTDSETSIDDEHTVTAEIACVCSLTQGFWKTHNPDFWGGAPDYEGWNNLLDVDGDTVLEQQDETFFLSGQTWFQVFWNAPKGNVYYNMAHQYMAAKLNVLNGAYNPTINADLIAAEALLNQYTPAQIAALKGKKATDVSKLFNILAGKFGAFNEGTTNQAGHCSEAPIN